MEIKIERRAVKKKRWLGASLNSMSPKERVKQREEQTFHSLSLAQFYHQNSKFHPELCSFHIPMFSYSKPDYTLDSELPSVELPSIEELPKLQVSLDEVLRRRRSTWLFEHGMTFAELTTILQLGAGVSDVVEVQEHGQRYVLKKRTYPSGGALYPVQVYLYVRQVDGLSTGIYRYSAFHNRLYLLAEGEFGAEVDGLFMATDRNRNPLLKGNDYGQASVFFFLAADLRHQGDKYGVRAYRLAMLEAGHLAQNLLLVSTALHKSGVPLASFYDDRLNDLLSLDGQHEIALYMIPIG